MKKLCVGNCVLAINVVSVARPLGGKVGEKPAKKLIRSFKGYGAARGNYDARRVKNWKPSFKKMWYEISVPDGEIILAKDVTCLADCYYEIRYGDVPYTILWQKALQDGFFWQWLVENEDKEQYLYTVYIER